MTLIAALFGAVIGAAIGSLIGALFLMLATKWVVGTSLGYGKAYGLVFVVYIVSGLVAAILFVMSGTTDPAAVQTFNLNNGLGWLIGLLFGGYWYGSHISDANGGDIGFGKGILVALAIIVISIVISVVLGLLLGGTAAMMGATGAGG